MDLHITVAKVGAFRTLKEGFGGKIIPDVRFRIGLGTTSRPSSVLFASGQNEICCPFRKLSRAKTVKASECNSLSVSHETPTFSEAVAGGGVVRYIRCSIAEQSLRGSRTGTKSCA
ncbi:MAG: hypothetical protein DMF29_01505 [Verrucomicrobia bacterium]|nr:MAG: hypothetical protein DMF29_01505 [Verrucomicrobiota bacterium]